MATNSRRLSILTVQEIDDLYGLPCFMEEERHLYFDMSPAEGNLVDSVHTISVAVHLILQIGYFKAERQFFIYAREAVTGDLEHILRRYFPARDIAEIKVLSKPTRLEQQQVILNLFDYQLCGAAATSELEQKAQRVAMLSTQPIFILREALQYLTNQRIVVPGYTYLQDMVGRTVSGERQRITHLLSQALTPAVEQQLGACFRPMKACTASVCSSMSRKTSATVSCAKRSAGASSSICCTSSDRPFWHRLVRPTRA